MSENLRVCHECGAIIGEDENYAICDEKYYCEECTSEVLICCERCGKWERLDYASEVLVSDYRYTREWWCADCTGNYSFLCDDCGEYFSEDIGFTTRDGERICPRCEENYIWCEECEAYVYIDDYNHDAEMCYRCAESMTHPLLRGYHGNAKNKKIGECSKRWRGIWRGTGREIEIDRYEADKKEEYALINELEKIVGEGVFCYEKDGSLRNGFEIITQPHTIDAIEKIDWNAVLNACKNHGYLAHDIGTCGLHMHFSRELFGDTIEKQNNSIAKLIYFFEHNFEDLAKASRREMHDLSHWADKYNIWTREECVEMANATYHDRYHAVNLTNPKTVEIRIMRGTLNIDTYNACTDLIQCICKKSRTIKWKNINDIGEWLKYIKDGTKKYLQDRNAFTEVI